MTLLGENFWINKGVLCHKFNITPKPIRYLVHIGHFLVYDSLVDDICDNPIPLDFFGNRRITIKGYFKTDVKFDDIDVDSSDAIIPSTVSLHDKMRLESGNEFRYGSFRITSTWMQRSLGDTEKQRLEDLRAKDNDDLWGPRSEILWKNVIHKITIMP